jgi:hypothetical protein
VADADQRRLGLAPLPPRAVSIAADGTVVDGLDLVLTQDPASPSVPREDGRKEERP